MEKTIIAETLWSRLRQEAEALCRQEPLLAWLAEDIILNENSLTGALARLIARKLAPNQMPEEALRKLYTDFAAETPELEDMISADLECIMREDPAARNSLCPLLFFKGFHALQAYRLGHFLWQKERKELALFIQNRTSDLFAVDIHPAAQIGRGILLDHATGIVIGETAVVEDDVLIWHGVTLGGRDDTATARHPKVRKGALIGAGATLLGNIEIGAGAKIASGATVVKSVPPGTTYASPPAKMISEKAKAS